MIRIKRIYESRFPSPEDGKRIFVDRLWPRGLKKEDVEFDEWLKEISPSSELRRWFGHDPSRWEEFKTRYRRELEGKRDIMDNLKREADRGTVTFLYAAKDEKHNNAVILKEVLD